ncbi:MAG: hypothetical protein RIQ94_2642 [Pseudomonadota bacterium]
MTESITEILSSLSEYQPFIASLKNYIPFINFLINLFTFFLLWRIKRKFLFRSSVDDHSRKIQTISSEISSLLQSYDKNYYEIDEKIALADVELRAISRGATGNLLSDVKDARALIYKYRHIFWLIKSEKNKSENLAREIKKLLSVVLAEFDYVKKDLLVGK